MKYVKRENQRHVSLLGTNIMKSQGNGMASLGRTPCRYRTKTESIKSQTLSSLEYTQF